MVMNLNMDLETRLANMYKSMAEQKPAEERKELTADEFWQTMRMVATNNQAMMNYQVK